MLCRNMCTAAVISIFSTKCSYSFEVLQIHMAVEVLYNTESKYVTMLLKVLLSFNITQQMRDVLSAVNLH